jgi:hypothetical protein
MEGMLALWASGVETDTVGGVDVVWDVRGDACGCA